MTESMKFDSKELSEYQFLAIEKMKSKFEHMQQYKKEVDTTYIGETLEKNEVSKVIMKSYFDVIHSSSKKRSGFYFEFF